MAISYDNDELNQAKREEAFERAEYNHARQQRADWEQQRAERAKDPQYTQQDYERDNVTSHEMGQREVEARNRYENAQTRRMEIEKKQNEASRQNEQNREHGRDDNQKKDNEQSQRRDDDKNNDKEKQQGNQQQQQQKDREKEIERTR